MNVRFVSATASDDIDIGAADFVVVHPPGALVIGTDDDVVQAASIFDGALAVAARGGDIYPQALCGPAKMVAELFDAIGALDGGDDERILTALAACGHDVVVDTASQFFLVLDGTGTDAIVTGGRVHCGGERPVVLIDDGNGDALDAVRAGLTDGPRDDLVQLLRYDHAVSDPSPVAVAAASDIFTMRFWTPEFCACVIRAAEVAGIWGADPDDPVPGMEVSLFSISPRLVALIDEDMQARFWPAVIAHWPEVAVTAIADAFVIRYEAGGPSGELPLHHDVAQVSAAIRLNEGYAGGALEFPRQDWDNRSVPVGNIVAWPSLVTHPHRSAAVTRGVKYGLTIWFELPGN